MRRELGVRRGNGGRADYSGRMVRLILTLAGLAAMFIVGPAAAAPAPSEDATAAPPAAVLAQTETTPEDSPDEDDPDEEEVGRDFEEPSEEPEPEQEEEPAGEGAPAPAPAPAPVAAPAPELPRTGTDPRLLLAAAALVLTGTALRRVARSSS